MKRDTRLQLAGLMNHVLSRVEERSEINQHVLRQRRLAQLGHVQRMGDEHKTPSVANFEKDTTWTITDALQE